MPDALQASSTRADGPAGIAIAAGGEVYPSCHAAYARAGDGAKIMGVLRIEGPFPADVPVLRVLFAPLAHTPEFDQLLCEVDVRIFESTASVLAMRYSDDNGHGVPSRNSLSRG